MRKDMFAFVALAILLSQPLVIAGSIDVVFEAEVTEKAPVVLANDYGTRLDPIEHTSHVAILIDDSADFVSQGWQGEGTENEPYIIAGLNITLNIGTPLIRIFNVNDYFVIEDCFVKQLSSYYAIHIENVTHAIIRHTTVTSPYGCVNCINADGTIAQNLLITSGNKYGMYITNSEEFELSSSLLNTSSYDGVYLNGSSHSSISNSIIASADPYFDLEVRYSDYVTITDTEFHAAVTEVYVYRCAYFHADGIISNEGMLGIYLSLCNHTHLTNLEITSGYESLRISGCRNISVSASTFSSPTNNQQVLNIFQSDDILLEEVHVNDTLGIGCRSESSNVTILNSEFSNIALDGIYLTGSQDAQVHNTDFDGIEGNGVHAILSHRANISGCAFNDVDVGINADDTDNATVSWNDFEMTSSGVTCDDCYGWEIHDNAFYDSDYGIVMSSGAHLDIWFNSFAEISSSGIYAESNDVLETWENVFSGCGNAAMELYDCDYQYMRDNIVSDSDFGFYIDSTVNSTYDDNIISDCGNGILIYSLTTSEFNGNNISNCVEAGINVQYADYATFVDNTMSGCGFLLLIEPMSEQLYNHSFSGNTVNGKPVYYAFNQTNIAVNGSNYGQVIIANSTGVSITEGEFIQATCGIQVMFSNSVEVSDVYLANQYMAAFALVCENISFVDSVVTGDNDDYGIFLYQVLNVWIENINSTGVGGDWFGLPSAILIDFFDNVTISKCNFQDLAVLAIAIAEGSYGVIDACNAFNITAGIYAEEVNLMNVTFNDFMWNEVGIYASTCDDWIVTDNYLHEGEVGLYRESSDDWYVANNTFMWNWIGIQYDGTSSVGITADNIIAANYYQNGDDDTFEYWDDNVDTGNYWGDYSGTGSYTVDGTGGAIDRYPMKYVVTEPIINSPIDFWIAEGSEGNEILWLPFDNNLKNWEAEMDGILWASGSWDFQNITVNIDGLAYGTHTIVITVWDLDLNTVSDTVIIHVYDDTPPEIEGPPNQWLFVDATGQTIDWEVSDLNPDTYSLIVDDTEFDSGSWTSGTLSIDVDDIEEGEHTLVLTIYDIDGNSVSDTILVRVIDDDSDPVIQEAEDVIYVEGSLGNTIDWSAEDDYPATYVISFNGTVVEEGEWGGSDIIFTVDGLSPGVYEYTLAVFDLSGNYATSSANVTVLPLVPVEEPVYIDWVLAMIVGAVIGGIIVVAVLVLYLRKRKSS